MASRTVRKTSVVKTKKKTTRLILAFLTAILLIVVLLGLVVFGQRSTENRGQAAGETKYPLTAYTTSTPVSGATSPTLGIDGNPNTLWSAAGFPRRWVAYDLGAVKQVGMVRLITAQSPAGATTHKVYVSTNPPTDTNLGTLAYTFTGTTSDYQELKQNLSPVPSGRYVTIETTQSPSFVAWREVEVYSPGSTASPTPTPSPSIVPTSDTKVSLTVQATSPQGSGATSPTLSVDGNTSTLWNAGGFPAQWITLKLASPISLSRVRLVTAQSPAGNTTHNVYVSSTVPSATAFGTLVHTFTGNTGDFQTLDKPFSPALNNVQYITIQTTGSPSFVAWREIEAYKPTVVGSPSPTPSPSGSPAPTKSGYTLMFNDEFDCPMVDNVSSTCKTAFYNNWFTRYMYGGGTTDQLNPDLEIEKYRDNGNHVVSGGTLKLIAKKIAAFNKMNPTNPIYESGMIRSKTQFQKNHYIEIRMKMDRAPGNFGAYWLASVDSQWPPEIDIGEWWNMGGYPQNWIFQSYKRTGADLIQTPGTITYMAPTFSRSTTEPNSGLYNTGSLDLSQGFHTYGLDWQGDLLTWYVDGVKTFEVKGPTWVHKDGSPAGDVQLLLNQAALRPTEAAQYPNDSAFASQMTTEIDYVRIFKKN